MKHTVKLAPISDQIRAEDDIWLNLQDLRELVKQADANGWDDRCLVSTSVGREHPTLRGMQITTYLVVEGPA